MRFGLGLATTPSLPSECTNHIDPIEDDGNDRCRPDLSELPLDTLLAVSGAQHVDDGGNRDENDNRADS